MRAKKHPVRTFWFYVAGAVMAATMGFSAQAMAASVIRNSPHYEEAPGCRDLVYKAMEGISYQNVIRDVQAAEEIILKPESVFRLTCFDNEQIRNADDTRRDRHLNLNRLSNRASSKVENWTNTWINNNYSDHIVRGLVSPNCRAMQNTWDYLTGNGAVRWELSNKGNPRALRGDTMYYYDLDDIWNNSIANARSINDESGSVLNAISNSTIDALETELFNMTNDVQPVLLNNAAANYGGYNAAQGLGNNIVTIFNAIEPP